MSDGAALSARLDDLERLLNMYRSECAMSQAKLGKQLDRIMTAALGDAAMGNVGFVELHRTQHGDLLARMGEITNAQNESRSHRAIHMGIPDQIVVLARKIDAQAEEIGCLVQANHDQAVRIDTLKTAAGWLWGAIATLGAGVPVVVGIVVKVLQ